MIKVQKLKDTVESIVGGNTARELQKSPEKLLPIFGELLNLIPALASTEYGTEGDNQNVDQLMLLLRFSLGSLIVLKKSMSIEPVNILASLSRLNRKTQCLFKLTELFIFLMRQPCDSRLFVQNCVKLWICF